jgi:hypothetical protein
MSWGEQTEPATATTEIARCLAIRVAATVAASQPSPLAWRLQGALHTRSAAPYRAPYELVPFSLPLI